ASSARPRPLVIHRRDGRGWRVGRRARSASGGGNRLPAGAVRARHGTGRTGRDGGGYSRAPDVHRPVAVAPEPDSGAEPPRTRVMDTRTGGGERGPIPIHSDDGAIERRRARKPWGRAAPAEAIRRGRVAL